MENVKSTKISEFFAGDFSQFALYNNYRSIASYIDGLKPSGRKVVYTVKKRNLTSPIKVSQMGAAVSECTNYLHGENSLCEVISGMAADYVGSNNLNVLLPKGNFGSRFKPSPAAPRYIYTVKRKVFDKIFRQEDDKILVKQEFEGDEIEPRNYVPVVPLILVNGSDGVATGFAQKILPRSLKAVTKALKKILDGSEAPDYIIPEFSGFGGTVERLPDEDGKIRVIVKGKFHKDIRRGATWITITELPPWTQHDKYKEFLIDLADKEIIDLPDRFDVSDPKQDRYEFRFKLNKPLCDKPDDEIMKRLKISETVTENFTCMDERNRIIEFQTMKDLLVKYVSVRLEAYGKRKESIIAEMTAALVKDLNRYLFIKAVVEGKLQIMKRKKEDVEKDMESLDLKKIEGSYSYLLDMPVGVFTEEKILDLFKKCKAAKAELDTLKAKDVRDMWKEDLDQVEESAKLD